LHTEGSLNCLCSAGHAVSCFFYLSNVIFACLYAFRLFTFFILSNMVILSCLFWLKLQVTPDFPCSQKIWEAQKYKEKDVDYLSSIEVTCLICHFLILALSLKKKKKHLSSFLDC
jgi:hypothetical protein